MPIYDAISDSFTHVAGTSQSYDLLANDQAGKASPMQPYDPANPQAVRWGSVCMFQTANGYRSDVVDPSALTYHSSVFTMPKAYALPADLSFALPMGVVLNRNGLMDVPASLPPGEYDLFYVYGTGAGEQTMPDGYVNDGSVYYGASLGCDPLRDYASVKLRVVAPAAAPVSVPTLEFGALIALGALVGAAGLRRQRRRG